MNHSQRLHLYLARDKNNNYSSSGYQTNKMSWLCTGPSPRVPIREYTYNTTYILSHERQPNPTRKRNEWTTSAPRPDRSRVHRDPIMMYDGPTPLSALLLGVIRDGCTNQVRIRTYLG